jgi:hypothetical protein
MVDDEGGKLPNGDDGNICGYLIRREAVSVGVCGRE